MKNDTLESSENKYTDGLGRLEYRKARTRTRNQSNTPASWESLFQKFSRGAFGNHSLVRKNAVARIIYVYKHWVTFSFKFGSQRTDFRAIWSRAREIERLYGGHGVRSIRRRQAFSGGHCHTGIFLASHHAFISFRKHTDPSRHL